MTDFAHRRGPGDMTIAQKTALRRIWQFGGADRHGQIGNQREKVDARTIVALVARGYLHGNDGYIVATKAGREIAEKL